MKKAFRTKTISVLMIVCMLVSMMTSPVLAAGSNNGLGNGDDPHIKISFTKDGFIYDEEYAAYVVEESNLTLSGTLEKKNQVKKFTYKICDQDGIITQSGNVDIADNWNIPDLCLNEGVNIITVTAARANGYLINESIQFYYDVFNSDKDSDLDGVLDWIEKQFKSDIKKTDTDEDGLGDYDEIFVLYTDPSLVDTDMDTISDGEEDTDLDGLSNIKEKSYNTYLTKADTDSDNLSDGEEVSVYTTSPLLYDTDGDGLSDGEEIKLGLDPLKMYSDDATLDSARLISQRLSTENISEVLLSSDNLVVPSISGDVSGLIDNNLSINPASYDALEDNRAVIGKAIDIVSSYTDASSMKLSFDVTNLLNFYDTSILDKLLICGMEDGDFIPCETTVSKVDNSLTTNISSDGIYFVLNVEEFINSLGIFPLEDIKAPASIAPVAKSAFVTDSTFEEEVLPENKGTNDVPMEWYDEYYGIIGEDSRVSKEAVTEDSITEDTVTEDTVTEDTVSAKDVVTDEIISQAITSSLVGTDVKGQADIVFVIDSTGSMYSAISNVVRNITDFVDRLTTEYNVQVNFALVDYKDITCDGINSTRIIKNGTSNWFTNVSNYKDQIRSIYVSGGGDYEETAIDALGAANSLDYRSSANKFIILVTDADYKVNNNYGLSSLSEIAGTLKDNNIVASVIAPTYEQSSYQTLYETTDGLFANIYGNFSIELLKLADKIGQSVNDGSWVLLKDYQFVKLNDIVNGTNNMDTDNDYMTDYKELGSQSTKDLTPYIKVLLKAYGIPEDYYSGKSSITVYDYVSNPVITDTDYDGINDNIDLYPNDNKFNGSMSTPYATSKVSYTMNYRDFFYGSNTYNTEISTMSLLYSTAAYEGANYNGNTLDGFMEFHGLEDVVNYKLSDTYTDNHVSEVYIGHRKVTYRGNTKDIVAVVVRGTNGTIEEWSSNFEIGTTDDYSSYADWIVEANHKGFDITATRIINLIKQYVTDYVDTSTGATYWITGHSRGAAISNIIGARLKDEGKNVYTYTYATPNTTTSSTAANYTGIYNIINSDDFVPCLPMTAWGFTKYGKTCSVSVASNYEKEWETLTGISDYNPDTYGLQKTVDKIATIADNRNECYEFTYESDTMIDKYYTTAAKRDAGIAEIDELYPDNTNDYYQMLSIYDESNWFYKYGYEVYQSPMFLMQILAATMGGVFGGDTGLGYATLDVADYLESAKWAVVWTKLGGVEHPHYTESYYVLSKHLTAASFY